MKNQNPYTIKTISEYHKRCGIDKPAHPLVSVIDFSQIKKSSESLPSSISYGFYSVNLKKNYQGKVKYGQQYYDFDEGMMSFYAPNQVINVENDSADIPEGWTLIIHPDFLHGTSLAIKFKDYGFFSYCVHEALHLSEKEEVIMDGLLLNLQKEIEQNIDGYSQDVIISHIELLLNYCNRFYNRQFITRKKVSNDLLLNFEQLLSDYFNEDNKFAELPTVQYFSERLAVSPNYLTDMLKNLTGLTAQQHIHLFIIEKAKELLSTTSNSVSEIAYRLGFEFPQSFNKLFKNKTNLTPLQFRASVN